MKHIYFKLFFTMLLSLTVSSTAFSQTTVYDIIADSDIHTTLEAAVDAALLDGALQDETASLTVFAPTDAAFAALGSLVDDLLLDPTGELQDILLYHVLNFEAPASAVTNGLILAPINDINTLKFTRTSVDDEIFVNHALVIAEDLTADNGIVHVIDAVVLPAETVVDIAIDNDFTTLTTAVVAAELLPALTDPSGTFTVFAPTNDAFAALGTVLDDLLLDPTGALADILLYHVLGSEAPSSAVTNGLILTPLNDANTLKFTRRSGDDNIFVNHAQVTLPDLGADNGVVHVIDVVVQPTETVVDVAIDNDFTTLTTAVVAAELLPALTDPAGTFTVFAPTNDAFAALGTVLDDLLLDPTGALADILLYHVLGSEAPSSAVTNGLILDPLNDANSLKFTRTTMDDIFVNQAQVTLPDVGADNGVVHVIDAVVQPVETVVDVAIDNDFTTLTTAVVAAELLPALTDPAGTFTVFAPTNDAFAALGTVLDDLLLDPTGALADILLYHVLGSEAASSAVTNGLILDPLNDANSLKFTRTTMDDIFVNQAQVTLPDVGADNGVVHVIDAVVQPVETVVDVAIDNDFTTLTTAVVAAELLPALTDPAGTFTVFAPTNDAFAALGTVLDDLLLDPTGALADILLYHVLGSEAASSAVTNGLILDPLNDANSLKFTRTTMDDIFVNQAQVTLPDVGADNGVVHVIDQVVQPVETVVDVAIDNNFNTLTTAVVAAELLPALTDPAGTFTVFAPTDDAFAALGTALDDLLADPTGDLADILLYHVLGTTVFSNELVDGDVETLLTGQFITVDLSSGVMINTATVVTADVGADNGVVHAIDEVLSFETISSTFDPALANSLEFFPNPTIDYLNINAVEDNYNYNIYDVKGASQLNGTLQKGANQIQLDQLLNSGHYFMQIFNNEVTTTISFIKQ